MPTTQPLLPPPGVEVSHVLWLGNIGFKYLNWFAIRRMVEEDTGVMPVHCEFEADGQGKLRGSCTLMFKSIGDARIAISKLNGLDWGAPLSLVARWHNHFGDPDRTIFAGNIPFEASREIIRKVFAQHGFKITRIHLATGPRMHDGNKVIDDQGAESAQQEDVADEHKDNKSTKDCRLLHKGFGYLCFETRAMAQDALAKMLDVEIHGRSLYLAHLDLDNGGAGLEKGRFKQETNTIETHLPNTPMDANSVSENEGQVKINCNALWIMNLPPEYTTGEFAKLHAKLTNVQPVHFQIEAPIISTGIQVPSATAIYASVADARHAAADINAAKINFGAKINKPVIAVAHIGFAAPDRTVIVTNIPESATQATLQKQFTGRVAQPKGIYFVIRPEIHSKMSKHHGMATVRFPTAASAKQALALDGLAMADNPMAPLKIQRLDVVTPEGVQYILSLFTKPVNQFRTSQGAAAITNGAQNNPAASADQQALGANNEYLSFAIFLRKVAWELDNAKLKEAIVQYTGITPTRVHIEMDHKGRVYGTATAFFSSYSDARVAASKINSSKLQLGAFKVHLAATIHQFIGLPENVIYISNVPSSMQHDEINQFFSRVTNQAIRNVFMFPGPKTKKLSSTHFGKGLLTFEPGCDLEKAIQAINESKFEEGKRPEAFHLNLKDPFKPGKTPPLPQVDTPFNGYLEEMPTTAPHQEKNASLVIAPHIRSSSESYAVNSATSSALPMAKGIASMPHSPVKKLSVKTVAKPGVSFSSSSTPNTTTESQGVLERMNISIPPISASNSIKKLGAKIQLYTHITLGTSAYGVSVYRGRYAARISAIKRLILEDVTPRHPILQEISHLASLQNHPNIAAYMGFHIEDPFIYIAMDFCDVSLADVLGEKDKKAALGGMNLACAKKIDQSLLDAIRSEWVPTSLIQQIILGLHFLHQKNLVHGNLRPNNVMLKLVSLDSPGELVATNHSRVRVLLSDYAMGAESLIGHTGEAGWRAPELLSMSTHPTPATDMFSFGLLTYYVLTGGAHPYGNSPIERDYHILNPGSWVIDFSAMDRLPYAILGRDLVLRMLGQPTDRPNTSTIIKHPYFWPVARRIQFLVDTANFGESQSLSTWGTMLEQFAMQLFGDDRSWAHMVEPAVLHVLTDETRDTRSVQGLLALVRDLNNAADLPAPVRQLVGKGAEGLMQFIEARFPNVFVCVYYSAFGSDMRTVPEMQRYF